MLLTIGATIVVLGVLILVHELGHFLAAKSVDIEVSRFSIGFGPKLIGFKRGETEYLISAFPLGGYVKMEGMMGDEVTERLEGGATEAGEERKQGRPPSPRDFDQKPLWARFYVIIAGVAMNVLFAVFAFALIAGVQGIYVPVIEQIVPGAPAAEVDIQPGDVIVGINGRSITEVSDAYHDIQTRPDETIRLRLRRGEQIVETPVHTLALREWNETAKDSVTIGQIGVGFAGPEDARRTLGPVAALGQGFRQTWRWTVNIGSFVGGIFSGRDSASELGGPILIGQLSGAAARAGLFPLLSFMAIISVNLAVLNLLPIPVLDGGHLLFLAIEGVRGREMSIEQRVRLTQAGMLFVFGLMVLVIANDIFRLVG